MDLVARIQKIKFILLLVVMVSSRSDFKICNDGRCYCEDNTMTFELPNGDLHCIECLQCPRCEGTKYDCGDHNPHLYEGEFNCTFPIDNHYVKHGTFEECDRPCSELINEIETQACYCDQNRKCECNDGYYRNGATGDCTKRCSKCPTSSSHLDKVSSGCESMPKDEQCKETTSQTSPTSSSTPSKVPSKFPATDTTTQHSVNTTFPIKNTTSAATEKKTAPSRVPASGNKTLPTNTTKLTSKAPNNVTVPPTKKSSSWTWVQVLPMVLSFVVLLFLIVFGLWLCWKTRSNYARRNQSLMLQEDGVEEGANEPLLGCLGYAKKNASHIHLPQRDSDVNNLQQQSPKENTKLQELLEDIPKVKQDTIISNWSEFWKDGIHSLFKDPSYIDKINRPLLNQFVECVYRNSPNTYKKKKLLFATSNQEVVFKNMESDFTNYTICQLFEDLLEARAGWDWVVGLKNHLLNNKNPLISSTECATREQK